MIKKIQLYAVIFVTMVFCLLCVINASFVSDKFKTSDVSGAVVCGTDSIYGGCAVPVGKSKYKIFVQSPVNGSRLRILSDCTKTDVYTFKINDSKVKMSEDTISLPTSNDYYIVDLTINTDSAFTLKGAVIEADKPIYFDEIYHALLICLIVIGLELAVFFRAKIKKHLNIEKLMMYMLCVAVGFVCSLPALNSYILAGYNTAFSVMRIEGVFQGLLSGSLFNHINQYYLLGTGYADTSTYPNIMLIIPAFLRLIRVSPVGAYNTFVVMLNVATALITYYSVYSITKSQAGGCVGSMLYTLAPYRLMTLYASSDLGESVAMLFLPVFIYALYNVLFEGRKKWYFLTVACVGIFGSNIPTAVLCVIVGLCFVFFFAKRLKNKNVLRGFALSLIFTLIISMSILSPFLRFMQESFNWNSYSLDEHLVSVGDLFESCFGIGGGLGYNTNMDGYVILGAPLMLSMLLGLYYSVRERKLLMRAVMRFMLSASAVMLYACTDLFPWKLLMSIPVINKIGIIQFAWRFMGFVSLFMAILGGYACTYVNYTNKRLVLLALLGVCTVTSSYLFRDIYQDRYRYMEDGSSAVFYDATSPKEIKTYTEYLYSDIDMKSLIDCAGRYIVSDASVKVNEYEQKPYKISLEVYAPRGGFVDLPKVAYPLYTVHIDGERAELDVSDNHCIRVNLPRGESQVTVSYKTPLLWIISDIVSVFGVIAFAYVVYKACKGRKIKD